MVRRTRRPPSPSSRPRRSSCAATGSRSSSRPSPSCARRCSLALVTELRRLTGHVEELHFLDLPGRLASRLVRLARESQPDATVDVRLDWPFTQTDLAAMIGGTRQTVNRLLADMTAQDLVRFERDTLVIPDLERLARAAER